jgi:diguanylate cyclase (GGDEF)-like protein
MSWRRIDAAGGGRLARLASFQVTDLAAVANRRLQLWLVTLFLLVSTVTLLSLALLTSWLDSPILGSGFVIYGAVVVLVVLFSIYTISKELELRALTDALVDERVLAAALGNSLRESYVLSGGGGDIGSRIDLHQMAETVLDCAVELLGAAGGSIMMLQDGGELQTMCSAGRSAARGARVPLSQGIAGQVAATREPMLVIGVFEWKHYREDAEAPRPSSALSVPLLSGEELIGVLNLNARPERPFSEGHLRALSQFGGQGGAAIARARRNDEQRLRNYKARHQAMHDPLTGLPNRALFLDRVGNAIARRRPEDCVVVILLLDLDDFKRVNDSLGHTAGDQVLMTLAERLRKSVRAGDSVAHLGGDEFGILLEAADAAEAVAAANRIHRDLAEPFFIEGREVRFSASIGIALEHAEDVRADEIIRNAVTALHTAKNKGKGQVVVFEQSMHSSALDRLDLEHELRNALGGQGLDVYFQPLMQIPDLQVHGFEALVRWHHPTKGLVSAINFVPLAEEAGLQPLIDRMVLQRTCAKVVELNAGVLVGLPAAAHVNLSPTSLNDPDFVSNLAADIAASGLEPSQLVIEITESVIMHDMEQAASRLRAVKALGVRLALDDFGTGYSSLSYLRRFPVDVVKIDRMFVDEIEKDTGAAAVVQAILRLGHGLNFEVVAEGIENEAQMRSLVELGCRYGQGYFLARPLSSTELSKFLSRIRLAS